MKNITAIDSNFKVKTQLDAPDIRFYDIKEPPFAVYGVFFEKGKFRRIPEKVAKRVSDGVYDLHTHTAGGRVRFRTDSPYVAVNVRMSGIGKMPHFALTGSAGFDLYSSEKYVATFVPPFGICDGYESIIRFDTCEMRDITINFPLYSEVQQVYVGLSENAVTGPARAYISEKPIVCYGSSITQGGCASRPGNSYESIISRRLNYDYINLGFSGNAKGEDVIAEYISSLPMSVFVYDYDHNAPSCRHLEETHEKMFRLIRKENPDLPVIILSRPKFTLTQDEEKRLEIIRRTYMNATKAGDRNVYFIEGRALMKMAGDDGTVDNCHPNDLGFMSMAKEIGELMEKLLK